MYPKRWNSRLFLHEKWGPNIMLDPIPKVGVRWPLDSMLLQSKGYEVTPPTWIKRKLKVFAFCFKTEYIVSWDQGVLWTVEKCPNFHQSKFYDEIRRWSPRLGQTFIPQRQNPVNTPGLAAVICADFLLNTLGRLSLSINGIVANFRGMFFKLKTLFSHLDII